MKKEHPFLRTQYNYDMNKAGDEDSLMCLDPSKTVQSSLEETDINTIVKRFNLTGQLPTDLRLPKYGDYSDIPDYHTAMTIVRDATTEFMKIPADIRARFQNDPGTFLNFCMDPNNQNELERLGLAPKPVETASAPETTKSAPQDKVEKN